jgi:D-psicose/D-tagatose/L-ribulose 3-epimerase
MKIGMNMLLWTTFVTEEHFPLIEKIKNIGFDGIEVPIGDGSAKDYRLVGDLLKDLGMTCTSVSSVFEEENPASPDPKIRQKGVDALKWRIDMAAEMGAEVIGGPFHSAFAWFSGHPPTAEERKWSAEVLAKAAEYAENTGVILTPEALNRFECYLFNTLESIATLLKSVNHPNLKMIYDTHHAHIEEKSQAEVIQTYSDWIAHVHISENDRGTPGTGQIHWEEVFNNLKAIQYDKWLTIEAFSRYNPEFASGINVWRNYQDDLEEVIIKGYDFIKKSWEQG